MTDTQLCYSFIKMLEDVQSNLPATDSPTYTVASVSNSTIVTTVPIAGNWEFGIVEITSGEAEYMQAVVLRTVGNSITLLSHFNSKLGLAPGDTLVLKPGPMKLAETYVGDPISVEQTFAEDSDKKYIITIAPIAGDINFRAMPGNRRGLAPFDVIYQFRVSAETPHVMGVVEEADSYYAEVLLPLLGQQLIACIIAHFIDAESGIRLSGGIAYAYAHWVRPGERVMKVCTIDFDTALN